MCAQWKMAGVIPVIILVIVIVCLLSSRKQASLNRTCNVEIPRMVSILGPPQPFPAKGEAIPDSCSWMSDFFLSVKCLPLPLSLTFTLCHSRETRTSSRKKIEWAGGPLEAASASPPLPKQFNSGPQLAYAAQLCKRPASSWTSILRWWFKEHLLWSEHILGGFVPLSWTTYQSFPSTTFSTRSLFFNNNALKPFVNWGSAFLPIWPDI